MTQAITITRVLRAVDQNHHWVQPDGKGVPLTRNTFRAIMIESELINNRRKIDEWYDNLKIAGYIRVLNQNKDMFVPEKIAVKLGIDLNAKLSCTIIEEEAEPSIAASVY